MISHPLKFFLFIIAGWMNRKQLDVIAYLQEENRVLRAQLGGKRLRFSDSQRRRLAAKAKKIGRKGLMKFATITTLDTLLRWFRDLLGGFQQLKQYQIVQEDDGLHLRLVLRGEEDKDAFSADVRQKMGSMLDG